MKFRRIRMNTGDIFLAPFDTDKAIYSDEWRLEWIPKEGEECFLMMNIGMTKGPTTVLTALFDGIYHYGVDTDNIDVDELKVLAIINVIPPSFTVGEFKKIDNQLIPESMPYMAYHRASRYITPLPSCYVIIPPTEDIDELPSDGVSVTGGYMYWFADYFIKGTRSQYLDDDTIDSVKVRPEAAVHKFFPEAKNNPNWVISQFGEDAKLQDREKYK